MEPIRKSIAEISSDAQILISEISRKQKGENITWEWLSQQVKQDVQSNRYIMATVKNRLLRDYGYVLASIPGIGYAICTDAQVVEGVMSKDRIRRSRSARRSKQKAGTVDFEKLSDSQKIKCLGEITVAHIIEKASTGKSVERIHNAMSGEAKPLALNEALRAISGAIEARNAN